MSRKQNPELRKTRLDALFADLGDESSVPLPVAPIESALAEQPPAATRAALVPTVPIGWTWACDSEGRYQSISAEIESGLGYPPAAFLGQLLQEHCLAPQAVVTIQNTIQAGVFPAVVEVEMTTASGQLVPVIISIMRVQGTDAGDGAARRLHGFAQLLRPAAPQTRQPVALDEPESGFSWLPGSSEPTRPAPSRQLKQKTQQLTRPRGPIAPQTGVIPWRPPLGFRVEESSTAGLRILPANAFLTSAGQESMRSGRMVIQDATPDQPAALAQPTRLGSDASLLLEILDDDPLRQWSSEERSLVEQVTDQLGLALDNARLFQQNYELLQEVESDRQRFSDLYNRAPDCYFSLDANGLFIEFNQTGLSWLGYTHAEVVNHLHASEILAPYSRNLFSAGMPRLIEEGRLEDVEVDFQRKDGSTFPVLLAASALYTPSGEFQQARAVARDVTHLRQLEQRQRQLVRAIEATADLVMVTDREGAIFFANPAAEAITGYTRDELVGKNPRILKSGRQDAAFYQRMWNAVLAGQVWRGEVINRRKNGSFYNAQLTISPIASERGEVTQFVAVQRDITSQKRIESEREKLLAETEVLYNASAELNAAQSYDDILTALRRHTLAGKGAHHVSLATFDRPWAVGSLPEWITVMARWSDNSEAIFEPRYALAAFPSITRLLRPDAPLVVQDIYADPRLDENARILYTQGFLAASAIFIPLVVGARWLGFINANYPLPTYFPDDEIRRLMVLAGQAAVAFQNLRLLDETRVRAEELSTLNTITSTASRSLDLTSMLDDILVQVLGIIEFKAGLISVADPSTHRLRLLAHRNLPTQLRIRLETVGLDGTLCDWVYRRGEVLHIANFQEGAPIDVTSLVNMGLSSYLGVPLESKGKILGTVCVFGDQPQAGPPANLSLLTAVGQQVGVAVENALLFAQTQSALSETETLYQASARLNAAHNYSEIVAAFRHHTILGKDAQPAVALVYFDRAWDENQPPQWMQILDLWAPQGSAITIPLRLPVQPFRWLVQNFTPDAPLFLEDATTDPDLDTYSRDWAKRTGFKSAILIPLVVGGQWHGFIGAFYGHAARFPEAERRSLLTLAGQAAVAVQNLQSIDLAQRRAVEAQRRSEELALVNRVISAVAASLDLHTSLDIIARELGQALSVQTGIALINDARQMLHIVASYSSREDSPAILGVELPLEGNLSSMEVIRTKRTLVVDDPQSSPLTAPIHELMKQRNIQTLMIVPMISGNRVIGTVGLDILEKDRSFQPEEISLAETIVLQATTAIQNARLFEQTEQALAETETLYNASAELNTVEGYDQLLSVLRKYTLLGLEASTVSINLFDHPLEADNIPDSLTPIATWNSKLGPELPTARYQTQSFGTVRRLLKADSVEVVEDPSSDARLDLTARQLFLDYFEARSLLLAPVVIGGQWIGHIIATFEQPIHPSEKEVRRLVTLTGQAAVAIQNIRLLQETRRRADQLQTAAKIARDTSTSLALDTLLGRAVDLINAGFQYYHASIFLLDDDGRNAVVHASTGDAGDEMKRRKHKLAVGSRSIIGYVTDSGAPLVINDVLHDAIHRPNPLLPHTRAEAGIPLKIGARVIGALDVQSTAINAFTEDDIAVLQTLADQIAVAVDNARAYEISLQAVAEMRKADQLKSQFLANMSHELRTPLNSIIGFSRVILKGIDGPVSELQTQDLTAIYNSGQHLLNLINDILDLSKIEAGKMELGFEENVNLLDIINSVMSTVMGLVKDKPIQVIKDLPAQLPSLRADPLKVRQVIINLLSNAGKFTEQGSITVRAALQDGPKGKPEILVSIIDTGPGIAPRDQARLFLPFSQVDGSATRKTGGTGLGLSICRHLVEMHGGTIGLTSQAGEGSTFYFTLPLETPTARSTGSLQAGIQPRATILCVDDESQVILLYERYLQGHGYKIEGLSDPFRVVETARSLRPAAITLDVMMPGKDGWQVLADLKADPDTRDIPVILCTILENQGKGFSLGASDYLMKPILEEDMLFALDRLSILEGIREILIVEPDANERQKIQALFENHPEYRLVMAEGGHQALVAVRHRRPQAVLLNLELPDLDGYTLLETLRADHSLSDIPVILLAKGDLKPQDRLHLSEFSQVLVNKGLVSEKELLSNLEQSLKKLSD